MLTSKQSKKTDKKDINIDLLTVGTQMLKFGVKGNPQERIIRFTPDFRYLVWKGRFFSFKSESDRRS